MLSDSNFIYEFQGAIFDLYKAAQPNITEHKVKPGKMRTFEKQYLDYFAQLTRTVPGIELVGAFHTAVGDADSAGVPLLIVKKSFTRSSYSAHSATH